VEEEEEFPAEAPEEEQGFPDEAAEDAPEVDVGDEPAAVPGEPEPAGDESLDEILATRPEERVAEEEEDEESILALDRDERMEALTVRVIPKQETEFVCQKCYLVKPIRSQLADKKRMYCRDCA